MPEEEDSGEEADFANLRKRLLGFQDAIGTFDPELCCNSFDAGNNGNWRDIEVALFELHRFSEPLKGFLLVSSFFLTVDKAWEATKHFATFTKLLAQLVNLCIVLILPNFNSA
jgi:Exportin-T